MTMTFAILHFFSREISMGYISPLAFLRYASLSSLTFVWTIQCQVARIATMFCSGVIHLLRPKLQILSIINRELYALAQSFKFVRSFKKAFQVTNRLRTQDLGMVSKNFRHRICPRILSMKQGLWPLNSEVQKYPGPAEQGVVGKTPFGLPLPFRLTLPA